MSIRIIKKEKKFIINTKNTTYAFEVSNDRYLRHLYYGKKTSKIESDSFQCIAFAPYLEELGDKYGPDSFMQEFSFYGSGDFHASALRVCGADGTGVTDFVYKTYRVFDGRAELDGLPAARADETTKTLEITMIDKVTGCKLKLYYTVFADEDIISRYMILENNGKESVRIDKCMSLMLDIKRSDLDMVSLYGWHCRECNLQRVPLHHGIQSVFSRRGATSHFYNPFMALCTRNANEERGEVYGFNFVYSGSFLNEVEVDHLNKTRVLMGLGSECFNYTLDAGESFTSPEAVMTYSANGFGKMSRNFHRFVRNRIMPPIALEPHPVVLNTWEAVWFDVDQELLINFAQAANKEDFDMVVMDDGWFGARDDDRAGLGDWYENRRKFPDGLKPFVDKVKAKGVKFGIWIEPEMVNPDSDLYRAHPEWCLRVAGREPLQSRQQLILDMSNNEVIDYLIAIFDKTFDGVSLDYFKWDMNRHMSNIGSIAHPAYRQGEIAFRYMKGVYKLLDWFGKRFPYAVIETCSGGGGRYDLGMMQYGIQIWTSDNTNPNDRTMIQSAAMMAYPATTMSCHVSNPHGDMKSLDYRYKVALGGMLGYELNILEMSSEMRAEMKKQIAEYREFEHLMRLGDYYNLASPFKYDYSAYYYTNEDSSEIIFTLIERPDCKAGKSKLLKIKAADATATYTDVISGKKYSGEDLKRGLSLTLTGEKDSAQIMYFKKDN